MNDDSFYGDVYKQDAEFPAHGWIQWKGTNVCIDLHCPCGRHDHIDRDFAYFYRCSGCGTPYALGQTIKLIPLTPEQAKHVEGTTVGFTEVEED